MLLQLLGGGQFNPGNGITPSTSPLNPCPSAVLLSTSVPTGPVPSSATPLASSTIVPLGGVSASACVPPPGMTAQIDLVTPNDPSPWWKRPSGQKAVIYFQTKGVPADWVTEMQKGVAKWNVSPCVDTRLIDTCQPNTNCVTVEVGDGGGNEGNTTPVTDSAGFVTSSDTKILSTLTGFSRTNVVVHEMGHAIGMSHRMTPLVLMNGTTHCPGDCSTPDATDLKNLLFIYGNQR